MTTIPSSWENCTLEDIAKIISGGTPKSSVKENFCDAGGVAWLTPADLSGYSKKTISHGKRNLTEIGYKSCSAKKMPKGSVLYSSRAPIGYVVISENEISTNQGFKSFVPDEGIDSDYLYYYLKSIKHTAEAKATGTTFKELSGTATKTLPFITPPANEQKRIVEKLESLLAQVDTIQQRLNNLPDIIKRFRQSVLAAAVSGKLTEQWHQEKNMEEWEWSTIGDVSTVATGSTPKRTEPSFWDFSDVPWLTSSVTGNEFCNAATQFVSSKAVKECRLKVFPSGSLLLAMYGEGKTRGQVTEITIDATCNQACAAILVDEAKISKSFVKLRLLENYEATRMAAEGGNQPNLNLSKVRDITIPVPSFEEQTEIVRLVEQYFALADTLEKNLANAKLRVDNLTQSILAKAFKGELVPQDPSDEPADKLLERIKTARIDAEKLEKAAKKATKASKSSKVKKK